MNPEILTLNRFEQVSLNPEIEIFDFLSAYAPQRINLLNNILNKTGFKGHFDGDLIVDLKMASNAGGYFDMEDTIAINPLILLTGTEEEIAHILIHESHHAGIYPNKNGKKIKIIEEVLTETLTIAMMKQIYGEVGIVSGYQDIVDILSAYVPGLTYLQIYEKISNGDENTLDNMIELIVGKSVLDSKNIIQLQWESIEAILKSQWKKISCMFPRIMNSTFNTNAGLHDESKVSFEEYISNKAQGLQKKIAARFKESQNSHLLQEILSNLNVKNQDLTIDNIIKELYAKGYGYLVNYELKYTLLEIERYIQNKKKLESIHLALNPQIYSN